METFKLEKPNDVQFTKMMHNCLVTGMTFPSGTKVPDAPAGQGWVTTSTPGLLVLMDIEEWEKCC